MNGTRGQKGKQWLGRRTLGSGTGMTGLSFKRWDPPSPPARLPPPSSLHPPVSSLHPPPSTASGASGPAHRAFLSSPPPDRKGVEARPQPGPPPPTLDREQVWLSWPGGDLQRHRHLRCDSCCPCLLKRRDCPLFLSRCLCKTPPACRRGTWSGKPWLQG